MSKFEELCEAYRAQFNNYNSYKDECKNVFQQLYNNFLEYFNCSRKQAKLIPLNKNFDEISDGTYSVVGAMHLDKDTYWHMGLLLILELGDGFASKQSIIIRFMLKKNDSEYEIKVKNVNDSVIKIPLDMIEDSIQYNPLFNTIFETIQRDLTEELDRLLEEGYNETMEIGFRP